MTRRTILISVGVVSLCLAVAGSLASLSVVRAGGPDGAVYLIVNVTLAALGIALLLIAWLRRPTPEDRSRSSALDVYLLQPATGTVQSASNGKAVTRSPIADEDGPVCST